MAQIISKETIQRWHFILYFFYGNRRGAPLLEFISKNPKSLLQMRRKQVKKRNRRELSYKEDGAKQKGRKGYIPSQGTITVQLANKNISSFFKKLFFFWTILVGEAHRATPIINVHNELKWGGNRTMRRKVHINCGVLLLHSPTSSPDASAAASILVQEALLGTGHDDVLPPFCAISHQQQSWLSFSYYSE